MPNVVMPIPVIGSNSISFHIRICPHCLESFVERVHRQLWLALFPRLCPMRSARVKGFRSLKLLIARESVALAVIATNARSDEILQQVAAATAERHNVIHAELVFEY